MDDKTVWATDAARDAARDLVQTVGRLAETVQHLRRVSGQLSNPAYWDGAAALELRTRTWKQALSAMETQLPSLQKLSESAERSIEDIVAASNRRLMVGPGTAPPSSRDILEDVGTKALEEAGKKVLDETWNFMKDFGEGLWGSIVSTAKLVQYLTPMGIAADPAGAFGFWSGMGELGKSLLTSPGAWVQLGKSIIAWDDWASGHPGRALGHLTPTIALTVLTWGAGGAASGAGRATAAGAERAAEGGTFAARISSGVRAAGKVAIASVDDLAAAAPQIATGAQDNAHRH